MTSVENCNSSVWKRGLVATVGAVLMISTLNSRAEELAEVEPIDSELVEEIITVGTRLKDRTTMDSPVPVQVFGSEEIESVATNTDLVDVVQRLVPSFNVSREPISDGASFMRPPFVRGLDSDKVLILVNGKRRHKGALVRLGGSGTHGSDIASLPVSALRSIEVLQDGASALYGSDAIAGVINFNLKDSDDDATFSLSVGEYTEGGGDVRLTSNAGLPLFQGFVNLSAEFSDTRGTSRGQRYDLAVGGGSGLTPQQSAQVAVDTDGDGQADRFGPDSLTEIRDASGRLLSLVWGADGVPDDLTPKYRENLLNPEQVWGEPAREDAKLSVNVAVPFDHERFGTIELYGFGNWRDSESAGSFFYRRPGVGQLNPLRLADGSIYNPRTRFPGGFTPRFTGNINDIAGVVGLQNQLALPLKWDVSVRYGTSTMSYDLVNTWNPSLGPASPSKFQPGELVSTEVSLNGDFERTVTLDRLGSLFLAFGFEFRRDNYEIRSGDQASYTVGPFARIDPFNWDITQAEVDADPNDLLDTPMCRLPGHAALIASDPAVSAQPGGNCIAGDPIYNAMSVGSNGFPGYAPAYAVNRSQNGSAFYVDLSLSPAEQWITDFALRVEDAASHGYVTTGKFATKFDVTQSTAIRSSVSSGFKSPTIGQVSTINVSTRINALGNPVAEGIFPTDHPVAEYFGAKSLEPERSVNFTAGLVIQSTASSNSAHDELVASKDLLRLSDIHWQLTLDSYLIDLNDRLTISSPFVVDERALAELSSLGIAEANSIGQVIYFTNALETRSMGMDLVGVLNFQSKYGITEISGVLNWNKIEITGQAPQVRPDGSSFLLVNAEGLYDFEHTWPRYRGIVSLNHSLSNGIDLMLRGNRFGSHRNASNSSLAAIQEFSPKWQWDAHVQFQPWPDYVVTASVTNAFDAEPDRAQFEACCGRIVRSDSLVPWQGPYYSLKISYRRN